MPTSKRIVSYCDPLSAQPGDEVRFMVSSLDGAPFDGQLVRLICGDISPGGHGYEEAECDSALNGRYPDPPFRHRALDFYPHRSSGVVPREDIELSQAEMAIGFMYFRLPNEEVLDDFGIFQRNGLRTTRWGAPQV